MEIEGAKDVMWLGLAFLFVVGGAALAYLLLRTGRLLRGLERDLHRTVDEVVPVISRASGTMDAVNEGLGKVDLMLDSAVDAVDAADTTVRAVSIAVTEPVKKVSGAVAGVTEAVSSFRERVTQEFDDDTPGADERPHSARTATAARPDAVRAEAAAKADAASDDIAEETTAMRKPFRTDAAGDGAS